MTKHQLRIGNKVKVFGKIYTIKELGEFEAAMEETEGVFVYSDVQGVELTPSILQACGFAAVHPTMMPGYAFYRSKSWDERHRFRWESVDGFAIETVGSGWIWRFREIKYIHQVQNLFYWVSGGTELTINFEQVKA